MKRDLHRNSTSADGNESDDNTCELSSKRNKAASNENTMASCVNIMTETSIDGSDNKIRSVDCKIDKLLDEVNVNHRNNITPSKKANYIHKLLSGRDDLYDDISKIKPFNKLNPIFVSSVDIGVATSPTNRIDKSVNTDREFVVSRECICNNKRHACETLCDTNNTVDSCNLPESNVMFSGTEDNNDPSSIDMEDMLIPSIEDVEELVMQYIKLKSHSVEDTTDNTKNDNIRVIVRCRPTSSMKQIECIGNRIRITKPGNSNSLFESQKPKSFEYEFDAVFNETATQDDIYNESLRNLIPNVINGANLTIFAYGCTGSGKTYTMMGNEETMGIVQLTITDLFRSKGDISVKFSFFEVYNESIFDLLNNSSKNLDVQEDSKQVYIQGLTSTNVNDVEMVHSLLNKGIKYRKVQMTNANRSSSRSHAILQFTIGDNTRLTFIDLAGMSEMTIIISEISTPLGSERVSITEHHGDRLKESSYINQSLLALANCINTLSEGNKTRVKYRDSKLTHILKNSLVGDSIIVMIALINPSIQFYQESSNTLKYASRAKNIKIYKRDVEINEASIIREFLCDLICMYGFMLKKLPMSKEDLCKISNGRVRSAELIYNYIKKWQIN